jgi:hypothetical protein
MLSERQSSGCKTTDSKRGFEKLKILNGGDLIHKSGRKWGEFA